MGRAASDRPPHKLRKTPFKCQATADPAAYACRHHRRQACPGNCGRRGTAPANAQFSGARIHAPGRDQDDGRRGRRAGHRHRRLLGRVGCRRAGRSFWRAVTFPCNAISFRCDQARFSTHRRSALMRALAITMSLRISVTTATFAGFPEAMRLSYFSLRSGL